MTAPPAPNRNPPTTCLNCGDARSGRYCAQCGQNDRTYMRSLLPMLWELNREAFEVDARILQTLKLLLFKPGSLSIEFSRNRRARYMSPIRLYLFTSLVFFLVLSWKLPDTVYDDSVVLVGPNTEELNSTQLVSEAELGALKAALRPEQGHRVDDILGRPEGSASRNFLPMLARLVAYRDPFGPDLATPEDSVAPVAVPRTDPPGFLLKAFVTSVVDLLHDPDVFLQRMIGNMPIAMFFLLPFLALALKICYLRKRRYLIEHLVFAIHVQTFIFLSLGTALMMPAGTFGDLARLFLIIAAELYYVIALRRFYGDGWIRTLFKGFIVEWLYFWVLLPGFLVALFLTG